MVLIEYQAGYWHFWYLKLLGENPTVQTPTCVSGAGNGTAVSGAGNANGIASLGGEQ